MAGYVPAASPKIREVSQMKEVWKNVVGYEGLYMVSNYGKVKNAKGELRKTYKDSAGYVTITLCKDGKTSRKLLHRVVAEAFLQNENKFPQVNHKDEVKENNAVDNLEWCTAKYNANYGTRNARRAEKEKKPVLQYSQSGVLIARFESQRAAASALHINKSLISCCTKGIYKTAGGYVWRLESCD